MLKDMRKDMRKDLRRAAAPRPEPIERYSYGWSASNVTASKSYDAESTDADELANVLGTMIARLRRAGIIGRSV